MFVSWAYRLIACLFLGGARESNESDILCYLLKEKCVLLVL